jgi:hypothetical protein
VATPAELAGARFFNRLRWLTAVKVAIELKGLFFELANLASGDQRGAFAILIDRHPEKSKLKKIPRLLTGEKDKSQCIHIHRPRRKRIPAGVPALVDRSDLPQAG